MVKRRKYVYIRGNDTHRHFITTTPPNLPIRLCVLFSIIVYNLLPGSEALIDNRRWLPPPRISPSSNPPSMALPKWGRPSDLIASSFPFNRRSDVFVMISNRICFVVSVRMRGADSSTSFHATSGLFFLFVDGCVDLIIGSDLDLDLCCLLTT